ncbi:MAG: glycosyltransferase family 4 protein [Gaiellaceae bacterium]
MVGISLLTLVPGVVGGSETYARNLVLALARVGELEYRVLVPTIAPDAADGLPARTISRYPASRSLPGRVGAMSLAGVFPGPIRRQMELASLAAIHFPLSVMLPAVAHPPAATTVLDVQHEFHPDFFPRGELLYRRVVYPRSVRRSQLVIAISEHVKETLVERLRIDPDRIRVIHLGVDLERFTPGEGPREPFLLYPANRWPHKNHERLFEAFALVRRERPDLRLVLTGAGHEDKPVPEGVEARGRVPDEDLAALYRSASALVFPSLYEGFGQPTIEAMACGCPVVASSTTALPEVVGDAARLFDPTSVDEMAAAVLDVLADPGELVARGLKRARRFTWDACARAHDTVYRELSA